MGRLGPGKKVLDVGSGSGYLTAVLAHLVVSALTLHFLDLTAYDVSHPEAK